MRYFLCRYSKTFRPRLFAQESLSVCNPPEDFCEGAVEDFGPFSISQWVFTFDFVCKDCLKERFSVASKVPVTELYTEFWDIPILGCVPLVFGKLLDLGCWFCLSFCQEILELISVLCLLIE